jgi:hypothetical protein
MIYEGSQYKIIKYSKWPEQNGKFIGWMWWSMPIIPATLEVETGGSQVQNHLGKVSQTLSKNKKF